MLVSLLLLHTCEGLPWPPLLQSTMLRSQISTNLLLTAT